MKMLSKIALLCVLLLSASSVFGQNDEREKGIGLYNKGEYKQAVEALQKAVKTAPNDAQAQTFLAMSQIKLGKFKDAEKSLVKSLALDPNQPNARKALAYVYLLRNKLNDSIKQIEILSGIEAPDAESFYILGVANLRLGNNDAALENADKAVKLNSKFANAYFLKAQAIMNVWNGPKDYASIAKKYGSSAENIGKFILLSTETPEASFWRGQQETLRVFAAYYAEKEKNKSADESADENRRILPIKILNKPRVNYTDRARQAGVQGTIRLLVAFAENGKVTNILVLKSLGYGLDEEALKAARGIKFEPQLRDGKPVTTVKMVEYSFSIY